jgi:multiple sugar transport system ATP-binding protein
VSTDPSPVPSPGFSAVVGLTEPIGSDTFAELDAGEASIVARVDPDLPLSLGQPVSARLRRSGIHLFDTETGERVN